MELETESSKVCCTPKGLLCALPILRAVCCLPSATVILQMVASLKSSSESSSPLTSSLICTYSSKHSLCSKAMYPRSSAAQYSMAGLGTKSA